LSFVAVNSLLRVSSAQKRLKISKVAVNRNLRRLGEGSEEKHGANLLMASSDPTGKGRSYIELTPTGKGRSYIELTPKGKLIVQQLDGMFSQSDVGTSTQQMVFH
jgi:hypothetical protein